MIKVEVFGINSAIEHILIFLKNEVQAAELTDLRKSDYREPLLAVLIECPLGLYRLETWREVFRWLNWTCLLYTSFSSGMCRARLLSGFRKKEMNWRWRSKCWIKVRNWKFHRIIRGRLSHTICT